MARTKNFADVIRSKLAANPDLADAVELEEFHADLAQEIHDARIAAGLTQKQLADRLGTHQSVIARMEDADYNGHSLSMLRRIAKALGKKFHVAFYSDPQKGAQKPKRRVARAKP
jgi:ribosome-binding protein aMBF1 (putative translation factor)